MEETIKEKQGDAKKNKESDGAAATGYTFGSHRRDYDFR